MIYVDPDGKVQGYEDVFTKIEMCRTPLRGGRPRRGLRGAVHPVEDASEIDFFRPSVKFPIYERPVPVEKYDLGRERSETCVRHGRTCVRSRTTNGR